MRMGQRAIPSRPAVRVIVFHHPDPHHLAAAETNDARVVVKPHFRQGAGSGLVTARSGKREKSRSADQSTRTPW